MMAPVFSLYIRRTILWIPGIFFLPSPYAAVTLCRVPFQGTSGWKVKKCPSPNSTSPLRFRAGSVCPVPLSVALTNGIDFLSPLPLT